MEDDDLLEAPGATVDDGRVSSVQEGRLYVFKAKSIGEKGISRRKDTCGDLNQRNNNQIVDSIVLGQAAGVEHVSFYSRTEHLISSYNEPRTQQGVNNGCHKRRTE